MNEGNTTTKGVLKQASEHFNKNQYPQALQLYSNIIDSQESSQGDKLEALHNRASLHFSLQSYPNSISDCKQYLALSETPPKPIPPELYTLYLSSLLKQQNISQALNLAKTATELYPYHKKLAQLARECKQLSMTQNEQTYVQHMFQKLCAHPKIREYLKDESFLTKVERLIRNPSLAGVLGKADGRIQEVVDWMLMAEMDD